VGVIRGEDGRIIEYQGVGFDITDRRRAEEALRSSERRARESAEQARDAAERARDAAEFNRRLVLEVDHRVRNNLAGMLSLVTAMRASARDVPSFAGAIEGRLMAMVHVHQLLADTGWRSVDLRTLVTTLLAAVERLGPHAAEVTVDGPPVPASPRQALPMSMILLEWFTNSGKYGAHSSPTGRVRVEWTVTGPGDKGQRVVRLRWKESGGPRVRQPAPAASLGTELVRGFATLELRGRYEAPYPPAGAEYLLEFPIQETEPQRPEPAGGANGDAAAAAAAATPAQPPPLPAAPQPVTEPAPIPPVPGPVPVTLIPSRRRTRSRQR
jgi:two-component sensor histidine kinase